MDPAVLHCQRKPGNMMMPVLCTVRKAGALHLTMKEIPYERNVSEFADVKFPVMPESYRQRSECPSETAITLEMTPAGFLKS